jgi:hypothetical protein
MKKKLDKLVATFLAFLILLLPAALSARERRGAKLVITLKDGHSVTGELIAVKPASLLLLNLAGKDESADVAEIRSIRVIRKSQVWKGGLYGFAAGFLGGAGYCFIRSAEEGAGQDTGGLLAYGVFFAIPAGIIGLGAGALAGSDKTIQLEGMPEWAVKSVLTDLRNKARMRDYK